MLLYTLLSFVPQVGVLELMCCHPAEELGCYYISYCLLFAVPQVGVLELMCCHPAEELHEISQFFQHCARTELSDALRHHCPEHVAEILQARLTQV